MDWTPHDLGPVEWLPLVIYFLFMIAAVTVYLTIRVIL